LERAGQTVVTAHGDAIWVNQWIDGTATLSDGTELFLKLEPDHLCLLASAPVTVHLRIPTWAHGVAEPGQTHLLVDLSQAETRIPFSQPPHVESFSYTIDHHGQEIVREDYIHVTRGPYVYAAGKIDGYDRHPMLRLPQLNPDVALQARPGEDLVWIHQAGQRPIRLEPFYRAGGGHDSAWRCVWFEVAWQ
jgi:hypothetical protein